MESETDSITEILGGRVNHAEWVLLLKLYRKICANGGIIFGGAVRDYVKRTLAAQKYEEFCITNKLNFKKGYNDNMVCPDTFKSRRILPMDIDVFINEKDYKNLIDKIQAKYDIKEKTGYINYFFEKNSDLFEKAIIFKQIDISLIRECDYELMHILLGKVKYNFKIKVDFIILKNEYKQHKEAYNGGLLFPPFGNPDFDINLLYMYNDRHVSYDIKIDILETYFNRIRKPSYCSISDNSGDSLFRLHSIKFNTIKNNKLMEIYHNIEYNIATPFNPEYINKYEIFNINNPDYKYNCNYTIAYNRIFKMVLRGYKLDIYKCLENTSTFTVYSPPASNQSGNQSDNQSDDLHSDTKKCIICFDGFTVDNKCISYNNCCNAGYHLECFIKYIKNHQKSEDYYIKCPHCRSELKYNCPCKITNFYSELLHKYKVAIDDIDCDSCIADDNCENWDMIICNCGYPSDDNDNEDE